MNKIYKVIWSKARNCYVVVSELAKRNGKCSSSLNKKIIAAFLAAGMTIPLSVSAAGYVPQGTTSSNNSVAVGSYATANGSNAIAVGNATAQKEDGTGSNNAIAVGNNAKAQSENTVAIGNGAKAQSENTVAIGNGARSVGTIAIAIGQGARAFTQDANHGNTIGEAPGAIAIGGNAWALTPYSVVIGSGDAGQQGLGGRTSLLDTPDQGGYSVSIGKNASNFGTTGSTGSAYYANTRYSTAIGYAAHTHAANATAIGTSTDATGERSFAFGTGSTNKNYNMHQGSRAGGQGSIVIGDQATTYRYAKREHDGSSEKNDTGADLYVNDSMAMGTGSWAQSRNAVALGGGMSYTWHQYGTDAAGNVDKSIMTNMTQYYHGSSGWEDDAEGTGAHVGFNADGGVAIGGATADVAGMDNTWFPTVKADDLTLTGYTAAATIGVDAKRAVAIGSGAAIGDNAVNSVAVGARNNVTAKNATAVGQSNEVTDEKAVAVGTNAKALGESTIAIGDAAQAAAVEGATAIGQKANASKKNAAALGTNAKAQGESSIALGEGATASVENSVALGHGSTASLANSVALGSASKTDGGIGAGNGAYSDATYTIGGVDYQTSFAAKVSAGGVVSVGSVGQERRIQNVAAGKISSTSTDAINGSQLYAAYQDLQWKASVSANGGKVSTAISGQVIGDYTDSKNKGIVNFKAGKGIAIDTANSNSLDMTFKANLQDGKNTKIADGTDGALKVDAYDTKVQAGSGLKMVTNGDNADANNVRTYKLDLSDANQTKINNALSSLTTAANGTTAQTLDKSHTQANFIAGKNMTLTGSSSGISFATKDSVTFTDVTAGTGASQVVIGSSGVQVGGNTYITGSGLDANSKKITNVAAGTSATDAVNLAQLNKLQWQVGITDAANTTIHALDFSPVGDDKNKIEFLAGPGIVIDYDEYLSDKTNHGYGIKFSTTFEELKYDENKNAIGIKYNGDYYLVGDGGNSSNTFGNDNKAAGIRVTPVYKYETDDDGNIKKDADGNPIPVYERNADNTIKKDKNGNPIQKIDYFHHEIYSPYIHVMGSEADNPSKAQGIEDFNQTRDAYAVATATGANAIAFGREADALAENALAIGFMSEATKTNTTAIGFKAHALANNAVSMGSASFVTGNRGIAIGTSGTIDNLNGNADHQRTWAAGQGSIVLGNEARAVTEDMRFSGQTEVDHETNDAIAIGTRADARAMNAIALGGNMSYSDADGNVTYGKQKDNDRDFGATVGEGAKSAIAIGGAYGDHTKDEKGNATGIESVTYEAAATYGARSVAIGTGATVANTEDFLDLKNMVDNSDYQELRSKYYDARTEYTTAKRAYDDYVRANPSDKTSIDYDQVYGRYNDASIALFGKDLDENVKDKEGGAQGKFNARIQEKIELELKNAESVADAVAVGAGARAETAGAVALGSNSVAGYKDRAGTESKITGYDERTGTGYNGRNSTDPAWRSTAASVSVGGGTTTYTDYLGNEKTVTVTRRISNVAAGVYDTDAVNVAQLKRAATINADNRNVALAMNDAGEMTLNSPYIHVNGVEEASKDYAIYGYGSAAKYREALEAKKAALEPKLGYVNEQGKTVTGSFDLEIAELDEDIKSLKEKAANAGNQTMKDGYAALLKEAEEARADIVKRKGDAESALKEVNALLKDPEGDFKKAEETFAKQSQAYGEDSVAIGKGSVVGTKGSAAEGKQSVAIGNSNTVVTDNTFVLGNNVTSTVDNSVFLGNNTAYVPSGKTTKGIENGYKSAEVNGVTFDNFAGGKEGEIVGVVSVGGEVDGKMTTRRIQNVAPGLVTKDSTDAVNGSQLWAVADKVTNTAKLTPTDEGTVNIEPETGGSNFATAEEVRKAINESGWNVTSSTADKPQTVLVKAGNTVDLKAGTGIKIEQTVSENGTSFTFSANDMGGSTISNVGKATEEGDAVSYGQMKKEAVTDTDHRATTIRTNEKGLQEISSPYIVIHGVRDTRDIEKDENTWAKAGTDAAAMGYKADASGNDSVAFGSGAKALATKSVSVGNNNEVSAGADGGLAVGSGNTVSGTNGIAVGTNLTVGGNNSGAIGDPTVVNATNSYSVGNGNTLAAGQTDVFAFGNGITETTDNSVFLGSGAKYTTGATTAGMDTYDSVTVNGVTHNFAGGKPAGVVSVGSEGQERRIQNVAAGKISPESTDAINGSQLYSAMSNVNNNVTNLGNQITNVDSRARKGIAGAAALAALHPMDFDPDDKLTFAAGMGHYRGETAAAIGAFYRADEKVMFSVGGTVGNGENMVNAGVSFSLDRTPRVTGSRTALTKEVVHLREQVARQDAQIAKQDQQIAMQGAQIAQLTALVSQLTGVPVAVPSVPQVAAPTPFPDNLDNKWAYDMIEDLEQRGYFTGYAGRELTRDEFAAALDRAMAGGAKLDERIIREFEPELSHVRVAHVEGKGNYEGEWYERPRASHDKYENKHEIAKKYSRVQEKKVTSKS